MVSEERIGGYRIVRKLGEGGMGAVYEGVHEQIGRRAAIKVLHPQYARNPQVASRFLTEARAANCIEHPGIVEIFEFGQTPDGAPFIVMEYLKGEPLSARMRRLGDQIANDALRLTRQIASALAAAHANGIIHRDLKPDNVMVIPDPEMPGGERIKVLDFGIAKVAADQDAPGGSMRTTTGMIMGTPTYMSPEQCRGAGQVGDKTDVYALGAMLYQFLCGQPPFKAEGMGEVMARHQFTEPQPLAERVQGISPDLAALCHRMLAKDPQARPTMAEVAAALESLGAPRATATYPALGDGSGNASRSLHTGPGTTLRSSAGQVAPGRRAAFIAPLLAVVLLLAGGGVWLGTRAPHPAPDPVVVPPPTQAKIRWSIRTEPAGAQVVRVSDGVVLGTTPYAQERLQAKGSMEIELRLAAHASRRLRLDLDESINIDRQLEAQAVAAPATERPTTPPSDRRGRKKAGKGAARGREMRDDELEILK